MRSETVRLCCVGAAGGGVWAVLVFSMVMCDRKYLNVVTWIND